jgi:hypothetical protein
MLGAVLGMHRSSQPFDAFFTRLRHVRKTQVSRRAERLVFHDLSVRGARAAEVLLPRLRRHFSLACEALQRVAQQQRQARGARALPNRFEPLEKCLAGFQSRRSRHALGLAKLLQAIEIAALAGSRNLRDRSIVGSGRKDYDGENSESAVQHRSGVPISS